MFASELSTLSSLANPRLFDARSGIVTSKEISFVNRRHVSVDKLNAALVDIINRYNVLKLPSIWGDGTTAAADGTVVHQINVG